VRRRSASFRFERRSRYRKAWARRGRLVVDRAGCPVWPICTGLRREDLTDARQESGKIDDNMLARIEAEQTRRAVALHPRGGHHHVGSRRPRTWPSVLAAWTRWRRAARGFSRREGDATLIEGFGGHEGAGGDPGVFQQPRPPPNCWPNWPSWRVEPTRGEKDRGDDRAVGGQERGATGTAAHADPRQAFGMVLAAAARCPAAQAKKNRTRLEGTKPVETGKRRERWGVTVIDQAEIFSA